MKKTRITRVESWVNLGIPDCILSMCGRFLMVELKVAKPNGTIKLSPHQVSFHLAHSEYPCFILASFGEPGKREIWLYPAEKAMELAKGKLPPEEIFSDSAEGWEMVELRLAQLCE